MRKIYLEQVKLEELNEKEKTRLVEFCEKNMRSLNTFLGSIKENEQDNNLVLKILPSECIPSQIEVCLNPIQTNLIIFKMDKLANICETILKKINPNTTVRKIDFNSLYTDDNIEQYFLDATKSFDMEELREEYLQARFTYNDSGFSDRLVIENYTSTSIEKIEKIEKNKFLNLFKSMKSDMKQKEISASISGDWIFTLETGSIYSAIHSGLGMYYWFLRNNYFLYS